MKAEGQALHVTLLGQPAARWDGRELRIPSRKGLAIVCHLACTGAATERVQLARMLWPESQARMTNLRWELHNLRSLPGAAAWLSTPEKSVRIRATTDLAHIDKLLGAGRYEEALELTSAPLLQGLDLESPAFTEWLEDECRQVTGRQRRALVGAVTNLESRARLSEARELVDRLLLLDPLDEATHRMAMQLALKHGDLAAASAQFEMCRRVLAQELGLEPTRETLELADAVEKAIREGPPVFRTRRLPPELLRPPQLVGRHEEWQRLEAAWDQRQIIFISGRPGIGKTRLAQDFLRSRVGDDVAVLRGHLGDQLIGFSGYARGWRGVFNKRPELIRELPEWVRQQAATFLPDMFGSSVTAGPAGGSFQAAMLVLYRQLLTSFGAAFVDDIQYFDEPSWRLGGLALQELSADRDAELGRMVITFRTDEMPREFMTGLTGLVAGRYAVHIELGPIEEGGLAELLRSLRLDPSQAARLRQLTDGNPYFVLEVLRRLHTEPGLDLRAPVSELLADSVQHILRARLKRLPAGARLVAQAVAALGEVPATGLLAGVTGLDSAEARAMLGILEEAQMIRETRLVHDLLQETILGSLTGVERETFLARLAALAAEANVPEITAAARRIEAASHSSG